MLLADLPDERFRIETLPHVRGSDRKHLRERRQAQIFPDTPYVAHQYLDREQSGRQDDRVLFVALNRPSAIAPWLAIIERNGHRLKRLVPAPFLATAITSGLPATSKPILLALRTLAGLRVSCIDKDKLLFSPIAATPSPSPSITRRVEDRSPGRVPSPAQPAFHHPRYALHVLSLDLSAGPLIAASRVIARP